MSANPKAIKSSVRDRVSKEEWQARVDLAAAYQLAHQLALEAKAGIRSLSGWLPVWTRKDGDKRGLHGGLHSCRKQNSCPYIALGGAGDGLLDGGKRLEEELGAVLFEEVGIRQHAPP